MYLENYLEKFCLYLQQLYGDKFKINIAVITDLYWCENKEVVYGVTLFSDKEEIKREYFSIDDGTILHHKNFEIYLKPHSEKSIPRFYV